jgi:5-deoxy-glucuronate isomerase
MHKFKVPASMGLRVIASPENSGLEHLSVASLRLGENSTYGGDFKNDEGLISILAGEGKLSFGKEESHVKKHDMAYICREGYEVKSLSKDFLAVVAWAPTPKNLRSVLIRADEALKNPELNKLVGAGNSSRRVVTMIGDNVDAARLLAGYTWVGKGNWSSWPPHEHGDLMEEAYIFYDMPKPGFGIQIVYEDDPARGHVDVVEDEDIVVIPRGYHPNVVAAGFETKYLWIISARQAFKDRRYGAWSVDPKFK